MEIHEFRLNVTENRRYKIGIYNNVNGAQSCEVLEFPSKQDALDAVDGFRKMVNTEWPEGVMSLYWPSQKGVS